MGGGSSMEKKKIAWPKDDFIDLVLSWSIKDIFDEILYQNQVERIPQSFESVDHYLGSFVFPLLEETRADVAACLNDIDKSPFAELISFDQVKSNGSFIFDVKVDYWRNICSSDGRVPYRTSPGDIVVISNAKPEAASDLQRLGYWTFAYVTDVNENEDDVSFKVRVPPSGIVRGMRRSFHIVFLVNVMLINRVWSVLRMRKNLNLLEKVLCFPVHEKRIEQKCDVFSTSTNDGSVGEVARNLLSKLNDSQANAIFTCLATVKCHHKAASVELICGPPGTGKTRTLSVMLVMLLRMKCRTVTCAPTDITTARVASELVKLVWESSKNEFDSFCPLGDILLFVDKNSVDGENIAEISLSYRVDRLLECFAPVNGWNHYVNCMICFLEELGEQEEARKGKVKINSLVDFSQSQFCSTASSLRRCMLTICTHVPIRFLREENVERIVRALSLLDSLEGKLFQPFSRQQPLGVSLRSRQCLVLLKDLLQSLGTLDFPSATSKGRITEFCIQMASLVFCTASTSYKLHSVDMKPFELLVVDDATQMKEWEAVIPLQLRGLRHVVLAGDECQLSTIVTSRISREAGFGRSLFERLGSLGHAKHLLNVQYRMHPSISQFPSSTFYHKKIVDAPDVKRDAYKKLYLTGQCFGPYAFINVPWGEEELDNLGRRRNLVEVALVMQIVQSLFKAWSTSKKKLSIGVVSPYATQILSIQDKLGERYNNHPHFEVNLKTIDGFQGGEEDIVIISTVRSNRAGSIGFLSSLHWTNVALTRARHCLWILGNEQTLLDSNSIWEALVLDAKDRQCFFHAVDDTDMRKTILDVKKEFDQLDDLLNEDGVLFKEQRWKVVLSDNFRKSFRKLESSCLRKYVLTLLVKLSSGWRPKRRNIDLVCESSTQVVKQFKVVEGCYIICTIDIQKEFIYTQVLKIWDILPLEEVPGFLRRLDGIYLMYTTEFINLCKEKYFEGDLEVPKSWEFNRAIFQYKKDTESKFNREYVENSRVSESLLLMKFYSLSSGVVNHLLSDRHREEVDIPFEVTNEEKEIILFRKSSFILGRSGTGKTTVLTMKLYQKEQQHHSSVQGLSVAEGNEVSQYAEEMSITSYTKNEESRYIGETSRTTLRQLFVTVSPKLCYAVNKQVSQLKSFALGGSFWAESSFETDDLDGMTKFRDIPNSFVDIPYKKYPLVITFHKFLLMLDGTVGSSYFDRFNLKWKLSKDRSLRSVALETFIREKEINYDRFCCLYWPHFTSQLTKNLDSSRVFTEIISHIKGGLHSGDFRDGELSRDAYASMSKSRVSNLSAERREGIYDIFQAYEKMKMKRGEFDISDLVNDLHLRLKRHHLDGDKMDFVYIDEVQDLTMRQLSLFKYICRNVDEGFVFSGDMAQTIARGVDFRFEDIRSLFYTEFVMDSKGDAKRNDKGRLSCVFQLIQNFRTHTGVLRLAQSVINLLGHYFPQSVDVLKPEKSLIDGAAPVLLKPGDDENAIITIFGNKGKNNSGKIVGFGAEQVILVRDESAKQEVSRYVGEKALILTIVECKGLEFQDVLLYNFFSSSPLGNQWRVVYEFMKEQNLADLSFPSFCDVRHNIMCSELKQLYVAITRTRQRLWICESVDEFSQPMFDYWRMLSLVEMREVDESIADTMQTFSTPEEWKSRGMKLFWEKNYEMALMCFKQAGETDWEKRAKAAGIMATVERIRYSDPDKARTCLLEAAEIFYSIGRFESAAECFYDLKDYKQAGKIYLDKCGKSKLINAAECFVLAGRYKQAAEVYAKGNYFAECLSACTRGKCYDLGMKYIEYWKQHAGQCNNVGRSEDEIDEIGKEFLENCAVNYFVLEDGESMMKFVRAFPSMDMKRKFLMSRKCLDELLLLEEESGNFVEAAEIARLNGNLLYEADLFGKGGDFNKACSLVLLYVLSHSLWMVGSKGWPMKSFVQKEELLEKAMTFAKHGSNFESTCTEIKVLSNESGEWSDLKHIFSASQKCKSFLGEILCCQKILDFHLHNDVTEYVWDDKLSVSLQCSEELISCCQASVGTLLHFWNSWRKHVFDVLDSLECLGDIDFGECKGVGEFCVKYFGVRQQMNGLNIKYVLLHPEADWAKNIKNFFIRRNKQMVFVDARHFISAARTHWHTELLVVGLKVLGTLSSLYELSAKSMPLSWQSMCLLNVYVIAKFLLESKHHVLNSYELRIQNFLTLSTKYFEKVFPLDPRESMVGSMISLRRTKLSCDLLQECIVQDIGASDSLSYGQIGRMVIICIASGELPEELYKKVVGRIASDVPWKSFVEILNRTKQRECLEDIQSGDSVEGKFLEFQQVLSSNYNLQCSEESSNNAVESMEVTLLQKFREALHDMFSANWKKNEESSMKIGDCLSPSCFLYLLERFMILVSQYRVVFFMIKSSFVEWLISEQFEARKTHRHAIITTPLLEEFYDSILVMVQVFIYDKAGTVEWIARSKINVNLYYKQMVLRLVLILCLLCMNCEKYYDVLFKVLSNDDVRNQLPEELYDILRRGMENKSVRINDFGEAFQKGGDPLLVVRLGEIVPGVEYSNVMSVQLGTNCSREDILSLLLPTETGNEVTSDPSANFSSHCGDQSTKSSAMLLSAGVSDQQMNWAVFQKISDVFDDCGTSASVSTVNLMEEVNADINFLTTAINLSSENKLCVVDDMMEETRSLLQELIRLHSLMNTSTLEKESIEQLLKSLLSRKPKLDVFLNQFIVPKDIIVELENQCSEKLDVACDEVGTTGTSETQGGNQAERKQGKGKGKLKKRKGNRKK